MAIIGKHFLDLLTTYTLHQLILYIFMECNEESIHVFSFVYSLTFVQFLSLSSSSIVRWNLQLLFLSQLDANKYFWYIYDDNSCFVFLNHYHYTITHLAEHVSVVKYFFFTGAYNGQSADCCSHFYIRTTACTVDLYAVANRINSVNFLHYLGR